MKLLIVVPVPERVGGAENRMYRFLEHVDRSRFDVEVAFLGSGGLERETGELGFRTHALPPARMRQVGKLIRTTRALAAIMREGRPDVVVAWGHKAQMVTSPALKLARIGAPLIWWQTNVPSHSPDYVLPTWLPATSIACVSHHVEAAQHRIRPRRRTFVIHPGIDSPPLAEHDELAAKRAELSIPEERRVIGVTGRLDHWKRQDLLIRALAGLRDRGHDVHGLVVGGAAWDGDPSYWRSVEQLAADLGLADRVTFTGHVSNVPPYVQLMDVFVLTSPEEAFGNALLEAMGSGVASVAVDNAGPAELVDSGHSGLLVERPDAGLIEEAVDRLLTDEELRRRIADNGLRHQRELFSADAMTARLEERLIEVARGTAPA